MKKVLIVSLLFTSIIALSFNAHAGRPIWATANTTAYATGPLGSDFDVDSDGGIGSASCNSLASVPGAWAASSASISFGLFSVSTSCNPRGGFFKPFPEPGRYYWKSTARVDPTKITGDSSLIPNAPNAPASADSSGDTNINATVNYDSLNSRVIITITGILTQEKAAPIDTSSSAFVFTVYDSAIVTLLFADSASIDQRGVVTAGSPKMASSLTDISTATHWGRSVNFVDTVTYSGGFNDLSPDLSGSSDGLRYYPIPTLNTWGMILLLIVLLLAAVAILRRRARAQTA